MPALQRFLLELDRAPLPAAGVQELASRSRAAAASMRRDGADVRFLRAVYVPEDGRCFLLFEAHSAAEAAAALDRAGIATAATAPAIAL